MTMDLTEYEGAGFLREGIYGATIMGFSSCKAYSGTKGLSIKFIDNDTKGEAKGTYWVKDPEGNPSKALWRLSQLAKDAGLLEESRKVFEPNMLKGKEVGIEVKPQENDPRYHEVTATFPIEELMSRQRVKIDSPETSPPDGEVGSPEPEEKKDDDSIPF